MNEQLDEQVKTDPEPFFVRFLEQQQALVVRTDVKAGRPPEDQTHKFPSDSDEGDI
jgi:hypothetical protein